MKKFLIIQTAFIGDVILATPVIEKLHAFFPDSQIDFLLRKGNQGLLENHPILNNILIWDKKNGKTKNLICITKQIRKEKYDYVINLQRFLSTGIITAFSKGKKKAGFKKNPLAFAFTEKVEHILEKGKHEVERNIDLIKSITDDELTRPKLYPSTTDFEKVSKYAKGDYITIAPTSVWFTKQFSEHKWVELINRLDEKYSVYLLGGPDDAPACQEIIQKADSNKIKNLAGELSFLQTVALMKDAAMNYMNDSAPLHMASSINAKTTAVFCSTVPDFGFTPLADNSKVVEVDEKLECRPCGLHGYKSCPKGHYDCSEKINIDHLLF